MRLEKASRLFKHVAKCRDMHIFPPVGHTSPDIIFRSGGKEFDSKQSRDLWCRYIEVTCTKEH